MPAPKPSQFCTFWSILPAHKFDSSAAFCGDKAGKYKQFQGLKRQKAPQRAFRREKRTPGVERERNHSGLLVQNYFIGFV
ncbi:hypothetical protein B9G79_04045 [Bdellovibrio bacteriovorus]|uniref:Uncharacterized protein n=1 Tax=Bdellovibrio bacteriovorus TaxID=959 RepID=A0A1Z3N5V7_BDEBC|nr:hypothetical protein B9G79_04045 [Bdellovibrio bacteriovorus]